MNLSIFGTHARIQDFFRGVGGWGGGGPGPMARKQSRQPFFFSFFLVLNKFYSLQRGSNGFITEKTILFQGSREGPTVSRGVQILISIETI